MRRRPAPSSLRFIGSAAAVVVALGLVACAPDSVESTDPTASASTTQTPTATSSPEPSGPVLVPEGTAEDNLPLFAAVTQQVWASDDKVHGRAYIDALVAAGFDKDAMQVTDDETTIGRAVESLQFSVRWGEDQCLIGQVGPSTGDPVTAVMAQLAEGRCLIGNTRAIDW